MCACPPPRAAHPCQPSSGSPRHWGLIFYVFDSAAVFWSHALTYDSLSNGGATRARLTLARAPCVWWVDANEARRVGMCRGEGGGGRGAADRKEKQGHKRGGAPRCFAPLVAPCRDRPPKIKKAQCSCALRNRPCARRTGPVARQAREPSVPLPGRKAGEAGAHHALTRLYQGQPSLMFRKANPGPARPRNSLPLPCADPGRAVPASRLALRASDPRQQQTFASHPKTNPNHVGVETSKRDARRDRNKRDRRPQEHV